MARADARRQSTQASDVVAGESDPGAAWGDRRANLGRDSEQKVQERHRSGIRGREPIPEGEEAKVHVQEEEAQGGASMSAIRVGSVLLSLSLVVR